MHTKISRIFKFLPHCYLVSWYQDEVERYENAFATEVTMCHSLKVYYKKYTFCVLDVVKTFSIISVTVHVGLIDFNFSSCHLPISHENWDKANCCSFSPSGCWSNARYFFYINPPEEVKSVALCVYMGCMAAVSCGCSASSACQCQSIYRESSGSVQGSSTNLVYEHISRPIVWRDKAVAFRQTKPFTFATVQVAWFLVPSCFHSGRSHRIRPFLLGWRQLRPSF